MREHNVDRDLARFLLARQRGDRAGCTDAATDAALAEWAEQRDDAQPARHTA
jgi:hypothetical protein